MTKPNQDNNCPSKCAYHCAQLSYTTQHGAVLIIFPLNLQTSITAQIPSIGGEEAMAPCAITSLCSNGISIGSAVFAELTHLSNTHICRPTDRIGHDTTCTSVTLGHLFDPSSVPHPLQILRTHPSSTVIYTHSTRSFLYPGTRCKQRTH